MKFIKKFETHNPDYLNYINSENVILPNLSYCEDIDDVHLNKVETKLVCKYNVTTTSFPTVLRTVYGTDAFKSIEIDGILLDNLVTEYLFNTIGEHIVKYELNDKTVLGNNTPLFNDINTLTYISIPNSVTFINDLALRALTGITTIIIPDSVRYISASAFRTNSFNFEVIKFERINDGLFIDFGLFKVDLTNKIFQQQDELLIQAFLNSTIPNYITDIGTYSFNSLNITNITLSNNINYIHDYAFMDCPLTSVTILATTPPNLGSNVFLRNASGRKIYVPSESVAAYKAASGWSTYANDIEAIQ